MDKVSIIISTKNESANLDRLLKSCRKQKHPHEIIVVDNFSTDQTIAIASKYTPFVYKKGEERSAQRNFGARKARGSYLLFLDADMELSAGLIEDGIKKSVKGQTITAFPEKAVGENYWEKSVALERNFYHNAKELMAARLFPKDLFRKIGGFDQKLVAGEDWDLTIRAKRKGCRINYSSKFIIHHEKINNLSLFLSKKRYYIKHIGLYKDKHPAEFSRQSALLYRTKIYLRNWPTLVANPLYAFGFLFIKTLIWYDWKHHDH